MKKDIYEMSYNDIISLNEKKDKYLELFEEIIKDIPQELYSNYKPIFIMLEEMDILEANHYSEYVFPEDKVNFYPNLKIVKTKNAFTCPISSSIINKGSECITYKPFLFLPNKKEAYVLKKAIKASTYYENFFPTNIKEFDEFAYKVNNSYTLNNEEYYNFNCNYGDITLRKLKRR